ncbi:MAG: bifunctional UDP-N-acetylglucosamine diphosphorylase/glucosamine-1-phosphate N-acetyltransferase GlmU [Hyphomicrobiaceae bacterium]
MSERSLLIVVLAAGKGTRMRSTRPKVLHRIANLSMLGHVLSRCQEIGAARVAVVVGPDMADVEAEAVARFPGAAIFVQPDQLGTADAVKAAGPLIAGHDGDVLVLYADTPLLRTETLARLRTRLAGDSDIVVLGFEAADPGGYGRLLCGPDGRLTAIREDKEASDAERAVRLCNSGVMGFRGRHLAGLLARIGNANAKGEYYLTDAVGIANGDGLTASVITCGEDEVLGVNDRTQLATAEAIFQSRARRAAMLAGVTMWAPETVYLSFDTQLGRDVEIEPNVVFGPGVTVEDGAVIRANCHFEKARIGPGAIVGPFSRLRPGADIGPDAHIGNFVEVKNATVESGAKANHLSYIGDGRVGSRANIGAGTIFCNYDGFAKHRTDIGAGAFVGSNSSLVAPVKIGDGAYIGSGSVITKEVAAGDLAISRSPQVAHTKWAERLRLRMLRHRDKKG